MDHLLHVCCPFVPFLDACKRECLRIVGSHHDMVEVEILGSRLHCGERIGTSRDAHDAGRMGILREERLHHLVEFGILAESRLGSGKRRNLGGILAFRLADQGHRVHVHRGDARNGILD